eukprot:scaffold30462_cov28-Tisochrysis_lutea.AAC.4
MDAKTAGCGVPIVRGNRKASHTKLRSVLKPYIARRSLISCLCTSGTRRVYSGNPRLLPRCAPPTRTVVLNYYYSSEIFPLSLTLKRWAKSITRFEHALPCYHASDSTPNSWPPCFVAFPCDGKMDYSEL